MARYDVVVVGAGPAGSSAALTLAQQGVRVALLERARFPRYKTCGAGIVGRAMQVLPAAARQAVERECHTAELNMLDSDIHFRVTREEPIIWMSMRDKLDHVLAGNAQQAGAYLEEECNVLNAENGKEGVTIETSKGDLVASYVIVCDGALSSVAKKVGWAETRTLFPAVEWEISVSPDIFETFGHAARFDFGLVPQGYAWVFPKGFHLSVGIASMRRTRASLNAALRRHLASLGIEACENVSRHGAVVAMGPREGGFMKHQFLLAGDAAGFTDPVSGEGISFATASGKAAARALLNGSFIEKSVEEAYRAILETTVLCELRPALYLGKLLHGPASIRNYVFRRKGQELAEAVTDVISGKATYRDLAARVRGYLERMLKPDLARIFGRLDID
jgi:geranylgeranyl reductase family protein